VASHADACATTRCLLLQEAYEQIKRQMIEALSPDRRGQMEAAFEKLMVGVLRNLESRNRDKFTQNLTAFRQEVKAFLNA
jgi:exportin-7